MVLEAWPGGRWYRDFEKNTGHFWGHVQVIKPPTLLEISGPLFMSYAAMNHVQYRLVAEGTATKLTLTRYRAVGEISPQHREGVVMAGPMACKRSEKSLKAAGEAKVNAFANRISSIAAHPVNKDSSDDDGSNTLG